jgi:hypothetical protein
VSNRSPAFRCGLDQGHKLITPETGEQFKGLQILLQLAAHQLEEFVAEVVAEAVVEQLEVVEVEEGQTEGGAILTALLKDAVLWPGAGGDCPGR